jgi:uncharacterized protein with HEPN domain
LTHAREIVQTLTRASFEQYLLDKNLRLATERRIEIIGEAAGNLSAEFQESHGEIPWRRIVAQRHVLAHEYGEIKQEVIYRIATVRIPELIAQWEPLIPPLPPESGD